MAGTTVEHYELEGTYLEACNCDVVCPCGAGEEPDRGTCEQLYAYNIESGQVRGIDVSGLTFVFVGRSDGKVLEGNLHESFLIDARASEDQREALLDAFEGRLGGPLSELANLVEERLGVHDVPISFNASAEGATLRIGDTVEANVDGHAPDATEQAELARRGDRLGADPSVGVTSSTTVDLPEDGIVFELDGTNAVRTRFRFAA